MSEFDILKSHIGHKISVVGYGAKDNLANVSIECEDCNEVLHSVDKDEISFRLDGNKLIITN